MIVDSLEPPRADEIEIDRVQAMIAWLNEKADEIRAKGRGSVEFHFRGDSLTGSIHEFVEITK